MDERRLESPVTTPALVDDVLEDPFADLGIGDVIELESPSFDRGHTSATARFLETA